MMISLGILFAIGIAIFGTSLIQNDRTKHLALLCLTQVFVAVAILTLVYEVVIPSSKSMLAKQFSIIYVVVIFIAFDVIMLWPVITGKGKLGELSKHG